MTATPLDFLAVLHPAGSIFSICAFGDNESKWYRFADTPEVGLALATGIDTVASYHGVYHCVPNLAHRPESGRGKESDALNACAVWADVDALDYPPLKERVAALVLRGAKKTDAKNKTWALADEAERKAALNAALLMIDALPIGPTSALIASGRGWHPYWLLTGIATDLGLVRAVNKCIAKLIHGDKCWDLARVLKVPGTYNRKDPAHPILATLDRFDASRRYSLESIAKILEIPDAPADASAPPEPSPEPKPVATISQAPRPDEAARTARARAYIARMPGGKAGDNGHGTTFKAALVAVRGFDLPQDTALAVLTEVHNPKCEPAWSPAELTHKVKSADEKGDLPRGYLLDQDDDDAPDIAEARGRFAPQAIDGMDSVERVFDAEAIAALADLLTTDPAFYAIAKTRIAGRFKSTFKSREFDAAVKSAARAKAHAARQVCQRAEWGSPAAMFPDAKLPDGCAMPTHWIVDPVNGLTKEIPGGEDGQTRAVKICEAPVFIVARTVDLADGSETLTLTWMRGAEGWRTARIQRGRAFDRREIIALAHHGLPVHSNNSGDLIEYLCSFEYANLGRIPVSMTSSALGWLRDGKGPIGFMAGRKLIPARADAPAVAYHGNDGGDEQIVDAVRTRGSFTAWKEAAALAAPYPKALVAVYAALAPALLAAVGAQNFVLDWAAQTSTGKSTCMRLAASCWGVPDERSGGLIRGWDNTRTFVESVAAIMNHLPTFLDDTKRARDHDQVAQTIYDMTSGGGRGRGSIKGIQKTRTFHTVLLSTGEAQITALTNDGGTKARVLSLWGPPFGGTGPDEATAVQAIAAGTLAHYGHAGPAFAEWLIAHRADMDEWKVRRSDAAERYSVSAPSDSVAGRLAEHVATLDLTMRLAHEALDLPWEPSDAMMLAVWQAAIAGAADADVARSALEYACAWAQAHASTFWGRAPKTAFGEDVVPTGGWSGRWSDDPKRAYVGFFTPTLARVLSEGKYTYHDVVRIWRDRGWLHLSRHDRLTFAAAIGPDVVQLIAVRMEIVATVAGGVEDGDTVPF